MCKTMIKHLLIQLLILFSFVAISFASGLIGVCDENNLVGSACSEFLPVSNLDSSDSFEATISPENTLLFFGCGLVMWGLGLKLGIIISTMKKGRG